MDKKHKILVTGATGYIGGRLIPALLEHNYKVRVLVRDADRIAGREWADSVEIARGDLVVQQDLNRLGVFGHVRYRHSKRWQAGAFGESFEPRLGASDKRPRFGGFLTYYLSHFQSFTLEASRYEKWPGEDALHSIILRYDGVIGYHTHGSQR